MTAATAPTLATVWLNAFADMSDARSFPLMAGLSRTLAVPGERRGYGGGRLRSYSQNMSTNDWAIDLPNCTPDDIEWLEEHANMTLVARDDRGHRIFCVYYSLPVTEHAYNEEGNTSLALLEVTATLEV